MKKLLFILPNLQGGGAERVVLNLIRSLVNERADITLFLIKKDGVYWNEVPKGIKLICATERGRFIFNAPIILIKLLREARRHDIIIGALELTSTYLAYIAGILSNKPCIGWVHISLLKYLEQLPALHMWLSYFVYKRINHLVFPSEGAADSLREWLNEKKCKKFNVIPNPFDSSIYSECLQSINAGSLDSIFSQPVVVAAGRLTYQKGFDILIHAHAKAVCSGINHNLLILGEGDQRRELEELVKKLGVKSTVYMPGFVSNPIDYMRKSSVFVLSSRFEGFGMVLLEAMLANTPIIATNCPSGPEEILKKGVYGILVPSEDVNALAEAISSMIQDSNMRDHYKRQALNRLNDYSPVEIATSWLRLFDEVYQ